MKKGLLLKKAGFSTGSNLRVYGPLCISGNVMIGDNCWLGTNVVLNGLGGIVIGDNVDISENVKILAASYSIGHAMKRCGSARAEKITIGDGTWIGANAIILSGVHIGNGCVVGAGAVVNKSVPDNCLVVGNPQIVKKRYEE